MNYSQRVLRKEGYKRRRKGVARCIYGPSTARLNLPYYTSIRLFQLGLELIAQHNRHYGIITIAQSIPKRNVKEIFHVRAH